MVTPPRFRPLLFLVCIAGCGGGLIGLGDSCQEADTGSGCSQGSEAVLQDEFWVVTVRTTVRSRIEYEEDGTACFKMVTSCRQEECRLKALPNWSAAHAIAACEASKGSSLQR